MTLTVDHILWAYSDLSALEREFNQLSGIELGGGGSHPGFGTHNSLASLGEDVYFEAVAPDPGQTEHRWRARQLAGIAKPRILTFSVCGKDLQSYCDEARTLGLQADDPLDMGRERADGSYVAWRLVYVDDDRWSGAIPFMIDWLDTQHPATATPKGCTLESLVAIHPRAGELRKIYERLDIPVEVCAGPEPGFVVTIDTPKGRVVLT